MDYLFPCVLLVFVYNSTKSKRKKYICSCPGGMHGCSLADAPLVNAEVDSMGGVVDSGVVGVSLSSSPQLEAIEIAQAELRREYDVREERRRELEFLEKGGNPLDFKFGSATSLSVQSTSLTGQPPEQPVTSEAHGDSVESSGRPEATVASEPNCADNLLLFDGENDLVDGGKNSLRFVRSKNTPSEQNTQLENNVQKSGESTDLSLPNSRAYKRRVRSRPNRDSARSSSTDINPSQNVKGSILETDNHIPISIISNGNIAPTNLPPNGVVDMVLDKVQDGQSKSASTKAGQPKLVPDCDKKLVNSEFAEPPSVSAKPEAEPCSVQENGFPDIKGGEEKVPNESANCSDTLKANGLDSESNCSGTCLNLDKESESVPLNGLKSDNLISSLSPRKESVEKVIEKDDNKVEEIGPQEEGKQIVSVDEMKVDGIAALEIEKKIGSILNNDLDPAKENVCSSIVGGSMDKLTHQNQISEKESVIHQDPSRDSSDADKHKVSTNPQLKLDVRAQEDSILKEAKIIEAKRKRIAQLSVGAFISENHQKSHWDFVLEEMAWLANDFAQERLWKISAAAQLSHRVASASRERLAEKSSCWRQKKVAHMLSKAVMNFWLSAEELSKETAQLPSSNSVPGVKEYAVRYLKYNKPFLPLCLSEEPAAPERIYDLGSKELSWEEKFTEENLFYTVPPGAMETYRRAIESHLAQVERAGSSIQEEVETSLYDAAADRGSHGNAFEEDEGETSTYLLSGDGESGKPSKFAQKKKIVIKSTSDLPFMQNKYGTQQSGLTVKRPAEIGHISSFPTKRMRSVKPRFTAPFTAGTSRSTQVPNKTDGSSGDNSSFQDDQSTFLGGSQTNMEVESVADFERHLPFDPNEVSKPKKKKKQKHLGPMYEQRSHHGNNFQPDLGAFSKKRFEKLAESNGSTGLFGQPMSKKPKMRHPVDNSIDIYSPMAGSIPSPVASQMSNMATSNKLVKILGGGNRGKKQKILKMPVGQTGPGSPWSSFEEQALIVLVHDLGPNWELISDAINNILQYKCIFRKPKECSEHHKELISRTAGDGADSAEDSGSSQPYPSTLPGIPKGSARALFQRLQEPIEEDMIKVHFEKIIIMSQKQHYLKMQNENKDQKPIQPHNSHALALSQVCPNNISGGPLLTPLDLCDTTGPSPDILSSGYQGTHSGGLTTSNTSGGASLHSNSGANSSLQGSPNMVHGNNYSSPSVSVNPSMRDGRYGVPRSASMSIDEHQRVNHYNSPMMPGRVAGTPQGTDRGVRMMAGGNGMGIMCRNMNNMARPGFPVINPSSVLNSGNMLNSNMAEPGNSMLRPRDSLNMMRPAQVPQHQRHVMVPPDHQLQATQGNVQGAPPFVGINGPPFPQQSHIHNSHPHLKGPNHSPQHQAHTIRLAKERHLQLQQQRILHQQQLAASSGVIPRGPPPQPPQSSLQHMSHVQSPTTSASVSVPLTTSSSSNPAMSQHQQKPHNLARNLQSGGNQIGKQRQKQPQQKQRPPPQQRAKIAKGHQSLILENPSVLNGQITEKPEKTIQGQGLNEHLVQQQRSYSGQVIGSSKQGQNSNQGHASPPTSGNPLPTSHQGNSPAVTSSSNSQQLQPTQKSTNQSLQPVQRVVQQNRQIINSESLSSKSPAHHGQSDSSPSQLSTTEQAIVKPMVGPHFRAPEQTQNIIFPKSTETLSDPTENPLTKLSRTKSQGSEEVQESSQKSLLPLSQEKQALLSEQIQPENCNLQATVRSTDNRLE